MAHHDLTDAVNADCQSTTSADLRIMARRMAVARRSLGEVLPVELLHDPALDILLALYQADEPISANNLAFYSTVSATVADRWLSVLQSRELVEVVEGRVALSVRGAAEMNEMLSTVIRRQHEL